MDSIFEDIRLGRSVDTEGAKIVVRSMVDSITRNPDAGLWYTQLRRKDEYTADHSLNVCILTLVFGRHLNFAESVLNDLGIGALLHDIGKMRIPSSVLNKPGPLTADELALVRQHPTFGAEILRQTPDVPRAAVDITYCHHERVDGEGYPRGLKAGEISLFSKMVAVVDVYDAITSNRVYHHGMSPCDALKNMYQWQHKDFDESLVEDFIQCLGIYPVGSTVQFNTGEIGIVMNDNKEHRLKPTVMIVLDEKQNPLFPERIVNLASYDEEHGGRVRSIKKVFGPNECPFNLAEHILTDLPPELGVF
jgi:HD-GYP domain-containing protein (c-di-GMP phosphodiesterase class II)